MMLPNFPKEINLKLRKILKHRITQVCIPRVINRVLTYPVALDSSIVDLEEKETRKQITVECYESSIDFMCLLNGSWLLWSPWTTLWELLLYKNSL